MCIVLQLFHELILDSGRVLDEFRIDQLVQAFVGVRSNVLLGIVAEDEECLHADLDQTLNIALILRTQLVDAFADRRAVP